MSQDGSRLVGDDAPLRKDLHSWMLEHPGFMAEVPDNLGSSSSSSQGALAAIAGSTSGEKKSRRQKADTTELPDLSSLTGSENVPVIHRESGKRLTGSKAPTLLQLSSWLEKNPHYDIDPVWGTLAKVGVWYCCPVLLHCGFLSVLAILFLFRAFYLSIFIAVFTQIRRSGNEKWTHQLQQHWLHSRPLPLRLSWLPRCRVIQ